MKKLFEVNKMFNKKYSKKEILLKIRNILYVIIGTAILAFGSGVFLIPFNLVTGGMSGVAIILDNIYHINLSFISSIDLYVIIITWVMFFLGLFLLGKDFALKTLISSIVYPPMLSLSLRLVDSNIFNGFFNLQSTYPEIGIVLAAMFGGAFVGAGCAITFLGGGSTGGLDILALVICKYVKRIKSSVMIFLIDALIVALGIFVIKDLVISLLGITSAFICALVIDKVFLGESKAFIAYIVSDKYEEINEEIIKKLDRTTTILDATGGYSKKEKKVVMISFTMSQYVTLTTLVDLIDKDAFVSIHRAHEINGEGWTKPSPKE